MSLCCRAAFSACWPNRRGGEKKNKQPQTPPSPSSSSGLRADMDNLTAQIEHNFLRGETKRWRSPLRLQSTADEQTPSLRLFVTARHQRERRLSPC